jgi:APA family basic amino acid/polyamine antiporter
MPVSPLLLGLAIIAGVYALWAIYGAGREAVGWGAVLIAAGAPVYLFVRWRTRRSGPRAGG